MNKFNVGEIVICTDQKPPCDVEILQVSTWEDVLMIKDKTRYCYLCESPDWMGTRWIGETNLSQKTK